MQTGLYICAQRAYILFIKPAIGAGGAMEREMREIVFGPYTRLTTDHPASSHGIPVLIYDDGDGWDPIGPADMIGAGAAGEFFGLPAQCGADIVKTAIDDRIGTMSIVRQRLAAYPDDESHRLVFGLSLDDEDALLRKCDAEIAACRAYLAQLPPLSA